jgi:thiol-disulfide isomerase/thioredoxin
MLRRGPLIPILCFLFACASNPAAVLVGKYAPYTQVTLLGGEEQLIDEYQGKPLVLVFWATWCSKSRSVLPRVEQVARRLKAKNQVNFLAVSLDKAKDIAALRGFIKTEKLQSFKHAFSGNEYFDQAYMAFRADRVPTIVIIDAQGKVVATGDDETVVEEYFLVK